LKALTAPRGQSFLFSSVDISFNEDIKQVYTVFSASDPIKVTLLNLEVSPTIFSTALGG
jgi:hypothetical protein